MKKHLLTIVLAVISMAATAQYIDRAERKSVDNIPVSIFAAYQHQLFNFDWKFQLGTQPGAENPAFDDSNWRTIDLPHDFQFEQPWDESAGGARGFKPMCEGWYRKTFKAEEVWKNRKVSLDFGGLIFFGDVYLNGKKVASTEYGYVGFEADITRHLRYDTLNVVAVYASTGPSKGSRWYTGGGLFRDVYLEVKNPTHIARHGVYVTTPEVSAESATVQLQVEVDGWQKHNASINATIRDPQGNVVAETKGQMPQFTHQQCSEVRLDPVPLVNPQLWDLDTPNLYTAEVIVTADGVTADSLVETFGVRKLEFSKDFGFKLNGRKVFLQGMANHHDMGGLGVASFDRGIERLMLQAKAFGYNCIRCSHNPYSESFTRIADRVGLLVVDELIDKWSDNDYWGGRQPFTSVWHKLIPEWVKRDRNCPSVILWSLGNELQTRNDWSCFNTNDWGVTTYRIFSEYLKRWDDTRLTTVAMFPSRAGALRREPDGSDMEHCVAPELAQISEVSSFNYQSNCYNEYLKHNPDMILFQSECQTSQFLWGFFNMDREKMVGLAYWGAVEYWGESNKWPKKGWNYSFFDTALNPYPTAYLIKSAFVPDEPLVRIAVNAGEGESVNWNDVQVGSLRLDENWNKEVGTTQTIYTFSNCEEVELLLNGKSLGRKPNNLWTSNEGLDKYDKGMPNSKKHIIQWPDVAYAKGKLVAIGYNQGKEVSRHQIETTGRAVALRAEAETPNDWRADGMDLQYIKVWAVDSKGRRVFDATGDVTFDVSGAASLYCLDNVDHYTDLLFTSDINSKPLKSGFMLGILRSTRSAGPVTVKISCPGMKSVQLKLMTK